MDAIGVLAEDPGCEGRYELLPFPASGAPKLPCSRNCGCAKWCPACCPTLPQSHWLGVPEEGLGVTGAIILAGPETPHLEERPVFDAEVWEQTRPKGGIGHEYQTRVSHRWRLSSAAFGCPSPWDSQVGQSCDCPPPWDGQLGQRACTTEQQGQCASKDLPCGSRVVTSMAR